MNNQSPLVPQGLLDQKNKGRARVKIAVFFVLAVHGVGLLALLLQGCHKEDTNQAAAQTNNPAPAFDSTNMPIVADATTTQQATTTNILPIADSTTTNIAPVAASEYTIVARDTYSVIAKKFGVTIASLKDANPGVEPTKLQVGKKLHIPAPTKVASTTPANPVAPDASKGEQPYSVKSGDTLIKIASDHHVSVRAIRAANSLHSDRITVGQKLKIPVKASAPAVTAESPAGSPAAVVTSR